MAWLKKDGVSDADLSAAARDMYEALEQAQYFILFIKRNYPAIVADDQDTRDAISRALAKARGEG